MAEDILDAEAFEVPSVPEIPSQLMIEGKTDPARSRIQLNITLGATIAFCVAFLIFAMTFGEMLTTDSESQSTYDWWETPLDQRHMMDLPM
ncbi:MAG: hypothetical protein HN541_03370, partial [Euryarchaeota archaeon]|nr:hypothetical protein [Euryarchaeota archaeon]